MAREAVVRKITQPLAGETPIPAFGGGEPPGPPVALSQPIIGNSRLAVLMFLVAEAMFFSGLIGAFIVFRVSSAEWPPPFQPRLPVAVTGVNTAILLLSGLAMHVALRAAHRGKWAPLLRWLSATALLGTIFIVIQGYEWIRLIRYGLTLSSGVYGATFYTLIGCHGAHVLGAMVWLLVVVAQAWKGRFSERNYTGVQLCGMYWTFVVALWPILYALVYLY
ncbi:MAG TPA: heme-copper oxidase subunit III [Candidatus Binatia bacterium]|jgi:heme/copper-type cytochrome/quinol oxidase subunit 3